MALLRPASDPLRPRSAPGGFGWRWLLGAVALFALSGAGAAWAASHVRSEYEVKAAFLLNFARLVEWPKSAFSRPDAPLAVAVMGQDPFDGTLEKLVKGRNIGNRRIRVKQISRAGEAAGCHIVFVSTAARTSVKEILSATRGASVLLVGESSNFASRGGAINFFSEDQKVRFEINPDAARRAGLNISSRLLGLAKLVSDEQNAR